MNISDQHTFHIPVMGLAYTIDSPIKVARFGIHSVVSIIQDALIEKMRSFYAEKENLPFIPIPKEDIDHRAKRITAYLNLMNQIVERQVETMKEQAFAPGNDIVKYFELLPENSKLKQSYLDMLGLTGEARVKKEMALRKEIKAGSIDVNIMTKLDKPNFDKSNVELPVEYCDAMSALRGYANSDLESSIVFSAGLNPRLYAYIETFPDFFPDSQGVIKKKIILKVSDYRSAIIQGKFLAKKGIWISEFRIESGLNCGGHAFPTEGKLLGPILQEFKDNRQDLMKELFDMSQNALKEKKGHLFKEMPGLKITVQGGIGTAKEDLFLREYYNLDGTGWGSPFLLVPEATSVDDNTLNELIKAKKDDYYLSHASPLGVPFNNFRKSTAELQRLARIEQNRPGSPCHYEHLASNREFSEKLLCTASRDFQRKKLKELSAAGMSQEAFQREFDKVTEKDCLCSGLISSALIQNNIKVPFKLDAVTICPGPNLAYFSEVFSLERMVGHIYGRWNNLNVLNRSHVFMNELTMYVDYLKDEIKAQTDTLSDNRSKYFNSFRSNILSGIEYYKELIPQLKEETDELKVSFMNELDSTVDKLLEFCASDKMKLVFEK
jgi:hypothetical protein